MKTGILSFLMLCLLAVLADGIQVGRAVEIGLDGKLSYESDVRGNRLPDFSNAGYAGGGVALPVVPTRVIVPSVEGEDRARIQGALDHVASLEADEDGLRGAVQLEAGTYELDGPLFIEASGVVLRGMGEGPDGTILKSSGVDRDALIQVKGISEVIELTEPRAIEAGYVPVGSREVSVEGGSFKAGDRVLIKRPSARSWIEEIGMDTAPARTHYRWKEGKMDIIWEREVVSYERGKLMLDAPLTTALEARHGGATVVPIEVVGRLSQVGIEALSLISVSKSTNPKDEEHPWMAVHMDGVEDSWVSGVMGRGFASAVVYLGAATRRVTVMDCASLAPRSELGGYRRIGFFTAGQQTLFLRCVAEDALHAFAVGYLAAGPNVYLECEARQLGGFSGSMGSWASGMLFDNVSIEGGALALDNLEVEYGGAGWAAANSALWQCSASKIICRSPEGALNWAIGVWGQFWGDGRWQSSNEFVDPESLYRVQLAERLGEGALLALYPRGRVEVPMEDYLTFDALGLEPRVYADERPSRPMRLKSGWLVNESGLMVGGTRPVSWWRGSLIPARSVEHSDSITRWLPGRVGRGETNDLQSVAKEMEERGELVLRHHWGLWYDRRREDHQMAKRMDAMVWPPFYEMPWSRSGIGTAWDGLSLYDLTRFNPWYFGRLAGFAREAAVRGRVLVNEMYFQHNILESGAHWVDFPWRPVNCLQKTGFTEPPPFTGDTIHMAHEYYDLSNPLRRELHRAYIRQCLDNLEGEPNVVHTLGDEYSGPLEFAEFWIDVIEEWLHEVPGRDAMIALSAPRDVQDAILANPRRAAVVDVIEFKYWWVAGDETYAPAGGTRLAPRQHLRKWRGGRASSTDLAGMVSEYRKRFPGKAIIYSELHVEHPWAALCAGASFATLPASTDPAILAPGAAYEPAPKLRDDQWGIRVENTCELLFVAGETRAMVDLRGWKGAFRLYKVNRETGQFAGGGEAILGGVLHEIEPLGSGDQVYWIQRENK